MSATTSMDSGDRLTRTPCPLPTPVPPRRVSGRSERAGYRAPRRHKLPPEQAAAIRAEAGSRSPRELAADFGVSHETVRTVLYQGGRRRLDEPEMVSSRLAASAFDPPPTSTNRDASRG